MEIMVPVCAVIGIVFSLFQWYLVSKVTVGTDKPHSSGGDKNGYAESLIEEEEGINDHSVVQNCAEIQSAISEGNEIIIATFVLTVIILIYVDSVLFLPLISSLLLI